MIYKINDKSVSWERVDDEVIAIQLETGRYYNMVQSSAYIWDCLAEGATINNLVKSFSKLFPEVATISNEIENFIQECAQAKLILTVQELSDESIDEAVINNLQSWVTPELNEYLDLQDLILVDPIHDVEETGWPNTN